MNDKELIAFKEWVPEFEKSKRKEDKKFFRGNYFVINANDLEKLKKALEENFKKEVDSAELRAVYNKFHEDKLLGFQLISTKGPSLVCEAEVCLMKYDFRSAGIKMLEYHPCRSLFGEMDM